MADNFSGPKCLPILEVDEELKFFSSNAATQYLFPILDLSQNGQWCVLTSAFYETILTLELPTSFILIKYIVYAFFSQQMQEWEATRLQPAITTVLSGKTIPSDVKQVLQSHLLMLDGILKNHKYITGVCLY